MAAEPAKVKSEPSHSPPAVIDIDSDSDSEGGPGSPKRRRVEDVPPVLLPLGFLDPLSPAYTPPVGEQLLLPAGTVRRSKQFWKAGDYDDAALDESSMSLTFAGIDHVRVHPRFLHSNATSHKWALGAFAELLDNAVDEIRNGAKRVNVDVLENKKMKGKMLVIEDDGGGMDPDKMRQCMSLGYSAKSKIANTIGQYGNGFKTSTMRLGADVIVFSRSNSKDRDRPTQSIGLLSYTFLTSTGKEDIIVPMVDYEKDGNFWKKLDRTSLLDLQKNIDIIVQWSPFKDEDDLLQQFKSIGDQGTRIVIYNLWEDDEAKLELDFSADKHDIQIRGVNRDEKRIEMAQSYPNARHYLTYQHSLRSYASILYLRLPAGFKMYLRGKTILHHDLVDDMMMIQEVSYRPQGGVDGLPKDNNLHAVVKLGFVKDAVHHIDIQGFNVYHKNRLIKPFWRVWNAAGSDGRGVIGVLEADFVEPAHDKQGFERTIGLQRLETKLIQIQKQYWRTCCHKIGYAPRSQGKDVGDSGTKVHKGSRSRASKNVTVTPTPSSAKASAKSGLRLSSVDNGKQSSQSGKVLSSSGSSSEDEIPESFRPRRSNTNYKSTRQSSPCSPLHDNMMVKVTPNAKKNDLTGGRTKSCTQSQLEDEQLEVEDRQGTEESQRLDLQIERDNNRLLEAKVQDLEQQLEEVKKENESLIEIFSEEKIRRDNIEEELRIKLKEASKTIEDLLKKVKK